MKLKQIQKQSQLQKYLQTTYFIPISILLIAIPLFIFFYLLTPNKSESKNTAYNNHGLKITHANSNVSNLSVTSYKTKDTSIINNKFKRWQRVWVLSYSGKKKVDIELEFIPNQAGFGYLPNNAKANNYLVLDSAIGKSGKFKQSAKADFVDTNSVQFNKFKLKGNKGKGSSSKYAITLGTKKIKTPLPVELTKFNAKPVKDGVRLEWHTASETNNSHFLVQRRQKNSTWHNLDSIFGHGTSIEPQTYSYIDKSTPQSEVFYYRLKQVDYDGSWELSKVISINRTLRQKDKQQNIIFIRTVGDKFKLIYNKKTKEKILKPLNSD